MMTIIITVNNMAITKLKKIAVHESVYEQLRDMGKTGDSFNDIIVKMLKIVKKLQPVVNSKVGTEENQQTVTSLLPPLHNILMDMRYNIMMEVMCCCW